MTVKSSVSLTDRQYAFARTLVDEGRYASVSAVLQQGVDLLEQRLEAEELDRRALSELLARRQAGKFVPAGEMDARLQRLIARKKRVHGVSP